MVTIKRTLNRLDAAFQENPLAVLIAAGVMLTGVAKVVTAVGNARGSHAYAKSVNYRIKKGR